MQDAIRIRVWGERACFTRPDLKMDRVSYEVMTPSAARGVLDAIYWNPGMRWRIERIHVLEPIRYESLRRNEVRSRIPNTPVSRGMAAGSTEGLRLLVDDDRLPRSTTVLRDVAYVIEAAVDLTSPRVRNNTSRRHLEMFRRRAKKGACFLRPYLGTREFAADFELLEFSEEFASPLVGTHDLGLMVLDMDFSRQPTPVFFHAVMRDGVVDVPPLLLGGRP